MGEPCIANGWCPVGQMGAADVVEPVSAPPTYSAPCVQYYTGVTTSDNFAA